MSVHQSQTHQSVPCHSGEISAATSPLSTATTAAAKQRMRWTPELHECFVNAVNQLGGGERMSEKKTAQSQGIPSLDLKTGIDLTEALRLQMEVQKQLHEQLEVRFAGDL
ncbi:hypothetical protein B296_00040026 [Ensete ventricosum]|uniref:MYB-CC type transcription factor LHEQLE-containing domain-containing protein n=1 Tax=Ensete ventricosum TaxID=4639 RepID=A0A426ZRN6_ENSVE|nr:hypothetical protein B296_00040026 [Ensete ventricosum]